MGHSHGQPFRQHTAHGTFDRPSSANGFHGCGRIQPRRKRSARNSFKGLSPEISLECYPHSTALIWLNATSTLPRNLAYRPIRSRLLSCRRPCRRTCSRESRPGNLAPGNLAPGQLGPQRSHTGQWWGATPPKSCAPSLSPRQNFRVADCFSMDGRSRRQADIADRGRRCSWVKRSFAGSA